jgi:hypothetical protein
MIPTINLLLDFCENFLTTTCLRYLKVDGNIPFSSHLSFVIFNCMFFHLFRFATFF